MTEGNIAERYVVVGAAGSIGSLIARLLLADGKQVDCIDLRRGADAAVNADANVGGITDAKAGVIAGGDTGAGGRRNDNADADADADAAIGGLRWIEADILAPTPAAAEALRHADVVVCAISLELLVEALPRLLGFVTPDCALIETLSIKSPFADLLERSGDALGSREVVGINPMFSGDLDPVGRPTAVVVYGGKNDGERASEGPRARGFFDVLRRAGLVIVPTGPRAHDRSMAALQTIVHGAVLAFGDVLCDPALDIDALLALAPPPFRVMFSLLARMTRNHPDVYWEIQTQNPYAGDARQALIGALERLDRTCAEGDAEAFRERLARVDAQLVRSRPETVALSKQIFDIVNKPD